MPKNINKLRKKTLVHEQVQSAFEYRYGINGYGRVVWGTIIVLSIAALCISAATVSSVHVW